MLYGLALLYIIMNQTWGESIFVTDLSGVQSVSMAGIILMLQLCVESWGIQLMVSPYIVYIQDNKTIIIIGISLLSLCTAGAQPQYYTSNVNDTTLINNVDCSSDEPRLRDCPYSNYTMTRSCQSGGVAGVRCRVIKSIDFATVSNSVFVTWEYNNITSRQPSSFDVRCNGQQHYNNIISVSIGTSRVNVGELLPNVSYDCCVSANYARNIVTTEIRCASIRSEDLLTSTDTFIISGTCANMTATVYIVGVVLGCVIVVLLVLLAVCGGALLRSRTSPEAPKR